MHHITMSAPPRTEDYDDHIKEKTRIDERKSYIETVPPQGESRTRIEERNVTKTKVANEYWKRMDDMFDRTIRIAELSYQSNRIINLIVVMIGIVLIANSIAYTWYKQSADAWSLFSGGIGIVSFITLFFVKPQNGITKALGNLAQIQMIYKAHALEFEAISDYDWEKFSEPESRQINEISQMNRELERATSNAVRLVQSHVEDDTQKNKETSIS